MKEKHLTIIEIIIVFVLIIGSLLFKFIPEYKKTQGSSDSYIDTEKYQDIIEITINNKPNFALVTDKEKILNILFFDEQSTCLYNQNIENTTIEAGIKVIVELLIENNYLKQNATIKLTKYKDKAYSRVKKALENEFVKLNLQINFVENYSTLIEKAKTLNITANDDSTYLKQIEIYSKDIIRHKKNSVTSKTEAQPQIEIDETSSREYTDNVYKKIEVYARSNNIMNQEVTDTTLPITLIPANKDGTIFPDTTSWYYIKDSKVYAYISITYNNTNYSYCYLSSIDEYKKGQC